MIETLIYFVLTMAGLAVLFGLDVLVMVLLGRLISRKGNRK